MARELTTLLGGGSFFESPRWRDGRWWVSDLYRGLVLSLGGDGTVREVMRVEHQPSGIGWLPDGSMLVVSMRDQRLLRRAPDGTVSEHADLSANCAGHLNDMVVDSRAARTSASSASTCRPSPTRPGQADARRSRRRVEVLATDLMFPNGSVITPEGDTLIVAETAGARYTALYGGRRLGERPADMGPGRHRPRARPARQILPQLSTVPTVPRSTPRA